MRPGYLSGTNNYWFSGFSGDFFRMTAARSAQPIITLRDQVYGKTAEELKALDYPKGWASLNIPYQSVSDSYDDNPYWNSRSAVNWNNLVKSTEQAKIFKLV